MGPLQYWRQIGDHRSRIAFLGDVAVNLWFEDGNEAKLMRRAAAIHDIEKIPFFLPMLAVKPLRGNPPARYVYDTMNKLGSVIRSVCLLGSDRKILAKIDSAERVIDVVDRHLDPDSVLEFGRPKQPLDTWLSGVELEMARELIRYLDSSHYTEFLYGRNSF